MDDFKYQGSELELFGQAWNWKAYLSEQILPFLGDVVFEVGAGIGATTLALNKRKGERWVCIEPDKSLLKYLEDTVGKAKLPTRVETRCGFLCDIPERGKADSILYIDVMEHIENHLKEIKEARKHLKPGGVVIVLSPAYQWLFSEFDAHVGHFRRYSKKVLSQLFQSADFQVRHVRYLDSAGMLASVANRFVLKQYRPNSRQIKFWDSKLVPISRVLDKLLLYRMGKSILGIYEI